MTANSASDPATLVLLALRPSLSGDSLVASLPQHFTVAQALQQIRNPPPKDSTALRALRQIELEIAGGEYHVFAAGGSGEIVRCDPATTRLSEIAIPREIRTPRGVETVPTVAIEVQAYAKVGSAG